MKYNVRITEVRQIVVEVEACSMAKAKAAATTKWKEGTYVHDIEDTNLWYVRVETLYPNYSRPDAEWVERYR